jgi:hypothetical protein
MTQTGLVRKVERRILVIRDQRVMLDRDLAGLYGVSTRRLNEQVRRNISRFPSDFMFQLTGAETDALRSQIATSNGGRGGRRYPPLVFTEQGVAMLSSVLHSERAVQVNIAIMRAFVRLRRLLATHKALARKLEDLERRYNRRFKVVFVAIRELIARTEPGSAPYRVLGGQRRRTDRARWRMALTRPSTSRRG